MQRAAALESRRTIRVSGCRGGWTFPWSKALQDEIVRPSRVASVIVAARPQPQSWPGLLSRLFGREKASEETVVTRMHFAADPQDVWNGLQFYEEVRGRPPFPLNLLMPKAVRTEGKKDAVGNRVRCIYEGGELIKRITVVDSPQTIEFEVIDQHLGIEGCAIALCGSYRLHSDGDATDVYATTRYASHLYPRWLWRSLEKMVMHQLHGRVLNGMHAVICENSPGTILK
jgi:hypothetical protein